MVVVVVVVVVGVVVVVVPAIVVTIAALDKVATLMIVDTHFGCLGFGEARASWLQLLCGQNSSKSGPRKKEGGKGMWGGEEEDGTKVTWK